MKPIWLALMLFLGSCAHLGLGGGEEKRRLELWDAAHQALSAQSFGRAESLFEQLARDFPETTEGRESLFYLGAVRIDPRNPEWDPEPAEARLRSYLAADSSSDATVHRRPEAQILLELSRQLNLPAEERIAALQPEVKTRVVTRTRTVQRITRVGDAQALAGQVGELRQQLNTRDAELRRLREELERIRKTLTGRRRQ